MKRFFKAKRREKGSTNEKLGTGEPACQFGKPAKEIQVTVEQQQATARKARCYPVFSYTDNRLPNAPIFP